MRIYWTVDLVNALEREKREGKAGRLALNLTHMDAVILDELGYLPFSQAGGALLFHSRIKSRELARRVAKQEQERPQQAQSTAEEKF